MLYAKRYITPRALFLFSLSLTLSLHHHRDKWHDNSPAVLPFPLLFPYAPFHCLALVFLPVFPCSRIVSARANMTSTGDAGDRRRPRTGLHLRPLNVEKGGKRVCIVFCLSSRKMRGCVLCGCVAGYGMVGD